MSTTTQVHNAEIANEDDRVPAREELLREYRAAAHERDHGHDRAARRAAGAQARAIGAQLSQLGVWVFNGDYHDLAQIIPFIEPYWTIYEQIKAAGKYPYNADFEGRILGLEDALPREETPIFLLQGLRRLVEGHELLAQVLADGYRRLTELATRERFFERRCLRRLQRRPALRGRSRDPRRAASPERHLAEGQAHPRPAHRITRSGVRAMSALIEPGANGLLASEHKAYGRASSAASPPSTVSVAASRRPPGRGGLRAARTSPRARRGATPSVGARQSVR